MTTNKQSILKDYKPSMTNVGSALNDLLYSFTNWRIFTMLGSNDIKKRYSRSRIGQFWLTISLAVNIGVMGFVWAYLFKMPVKEYLPFLACGTIIWAYISTCINEGTTLYVTATPYLQALNLPKLTYVNSLFVRNIIVLFHNLLVLIPVFLICSSNISIGNMGAALAGFVVITLFLYPTVIILSLIGLRFRDFANIMTSLMQIIFYLTPIMWKVSLMPTRFQDYLILNPFAVLLSLCRNPLFSTKIPTDYWLAAGIYIILAWAVAFPLYSKFRSRISYWL